MVARALVQSRSEAEELIGAGRVLVAGAPAGKASRQVAPGEAIVVTHRRPFASRAGEKLAGALGAFGIDVPGRSALDAGSSTGGFTDCLLQRGARRVAGFDVGRGQMVEPLRSDPRVAQQDGFNVRNLLRGDLPFPCSLAVVDVSFISLRIVAGPILDALSAETAENSGTSWEREAVLLVKPQFEATPREVSRGGGVIRDTDIHRRVCDEIAEHVRSLGWHVSEPVTSSVTGGSGNVEYLLHVSAARQDTRGTQ